MVAPLLLVEELLVVPLLVVPLLLVEELAAPEAGAEQRLRHCWRMRWNLLLPRSRSLRSSRRWSYRRSCRRRFHWPPYPSPHLRRQRCL